VRAWHGQKWLERTPGLNHGAYSWWDDYTAAVHRMLRDQRAAVDAVRRPAARTGPIATAHLGRPRAQRPDLDERTRESLRLACTKNEEEFDNILDGAKHEALRREGARTLSHRALQGALMIHLYRCVHPECTCPRRPRPAPDRDVVVSAGRFEPRYSQPHTFLAQLKEADAMVGKWRYEHVQMVQRMIGAKVGTGGSSGYQYLRGTLTDKYKVFADLCNLPTYLVPREYTPPLPPALARALDYSDA
jgi:tryptophan 2,3-dioxygenase